MASFSRTMKIVDLKTEFVPVASPVTGQLVTKERFTLYLQNPGDGIETPPQEWVLSSLDPTAAFSLGFKIGESINVTFDYEGPDAPPLILNGTFDDGTSWVLAEGWTIAGGQASFAGSGGFLYQAVPAMVAGTTYHLSFDLIETDGEAIQAYFMADPVTPLGAPIIMTLKPAGTTPMGGEPAPVGATGIGIGGASWRNVFTIDNVVLTVMQ